jgi:tagatose-1,6-bisphosphate aldolase non-catalytic subunit AgaZ/GatZ
MSLYDTLSLLRESGITLLGVCPMSEIIIQAALEEARDYRFPMMFIPTLNQVDLDGGYTGFTSETFVKKVNEIALQLGYRGPVIYARDHGGPWLRDHQKKVAEESAAMRYVMRSFLSDIVAGFNLLHIDCTVGPQGRTPTMKEVITRTGHLFGFVENVSTNLGINMCYEVGTEEVSGGLTELGDFERYLANLEDELKRRGIISRPSFIVGQTGTNLGLEGAGTFDPARARELVAIAMRYDVGIKQHFTDDLPHSVLKQFPRIGIAAANVGPEYASTETRAYLELEEKEKDLDVRDPSNLYNTIEPLVIKDGRWSRWLPGKTVSELTDAERRGIVIACMRYVQRDPRICQSLQKLFKNLEAVGQNPYGHVIGRVRESIHRYVEAFNLENLNEKLSLQ